MRPFEFVIAFYSVVLGVAVAQLMTGVGRLVEERKRVRPYWVHSLWVLTLLLVDVDNWWSLWLVRDIQSWSIFTFLLLTALVGVIYLVTVLLFPRIPNESAPIDLRAHFFENSRFLLFGNGAAWALALACNWSFLPFSSWLDPWVSVPAFIVVFAILAGCTKNPRAHALFSLANFAAILLLLWHDGGKIQ